MSDEHDLAPGRLARATRPGGVLCLGLAEGDGERWSVHESIRAPRRSTFWAEAPVRSVLDGAGWEVLESDRSTGDDGQPWLTIRASRRENT